MPSSIGLRRELIQPNLLSYAAHSARGYSGKYCDGDIVVGMDFNDAVIGPILALAGAKSVNTYAMADGSAPDAESISALLSYGGGGATPANNHEWIYTGVKPNAIRFDIAADTNSSVTLVGIGQGVTKTAIGSAETPNAPAETNVVMPTDIGTVSVDGDVICLHSATLEVLVPKTGFERRCLGGTMKEPITNGRPDVTWTLNLDLDDQVSNDTIAILAEFVAGTALGTIALGSEFIMMDCVMGGDFPPLKEGQIDFTISGTASKLSVTTT
jgi:hypothetical protein